MKRWRAREREKLKRQERRVEGVKAGRKERGRRREGGREGRSWERNCDRNMSTLPHDQRFFFTASLASCG